MKIIGISDSHSQHRSLKVPKCDILIFSGDANLSTKSGAIDFLDWFGDQESKYKIFICGNHDWVGETDNSWLRETCEDRDIIYLEHDSVEILGIKFFGSPYTPEFCGWAFMKEDEDLAEMWKDIPEDTDILITHGPAYGIMDQCPWSVGSRSLLNRIDELRKNSLRYHIFGHIHTHGGKCKRIDKVVFHNVSLLDDSYKAYEIDWEKRSIDYD